MKWLSEQAKGFFDTVRFTIGAIALSVVFGLLIYLWFTFSIWEIAAILFGLFLSVRTLVISSDTIHNILKITLILLRKYNAEQAEKAEIVSVKPEAEKEPEPLPYPSGGGKISYNSDDIADLLDYIAEWLEDCLSGKNGLSIGLAKKEKWEKVFGFLRGRQVKKMSEKPNQEPNQAELEPNETEQIEV